MLIIDAEIQGLIPPLTAEERAGLEADIAERGCRDKLVAWRTGVVGAPDILLDGHNRHEICVRLEKPFELMVMRFPSKDAAKAWVIRNQFNRRNLTPFQRAELALQLEPAVAGVAKEKMSEGGKIAGRGRPKEKGVQNSAHPISDKVDEVDEVDGGRGKTREQLAKAAGVSHDTIAKVKEIKAKGSPETVAAVREGKLSINEAHKALKAAERARDKAAVAERIAAEPVPTPEGPFRVIVVDPPWPYGNRKDDETHRGRTQYPDMTIEQIDALPVATLAEKDAVVMLWTTNAFLHEAFHLMDGWGFTVKTVLTWNKVNLGLGDYLRNVTEHCLLGVRGKPVLMLTNQTTLITEKRREHSRKPEAFYALVESLCPGSKLEMFSRTDRANWTAWGAETDVW